MKSPPLGLGADDITWPNQVAPWDRKASSNPNLTPQTSNLSSFGVQIPPEIIAALLHAFGPLAMTL